MKHGLLQGLTVPIAMGMSLEHVSINLNLCCIQWYKFSIPEKLFSKMLTVWNRFSYATIKLQYLTLVYSKSANNYTSK